MQKKSTTILYIITGILIFLLGWHAGRIMSPYYSSQQIIFQDRECSACMSSGGTQTQLQELQQQGVTQRERKTNEKEIAGTTNQQGEFVASINSDLYHHTSCSSANRIKQENKVMFQNVEEARASGRTPSQCTQKLGL